MERHIPVTRLEEQEMGLEEIFLDITDDRNADKEVRSGEEDSDGGNL